MRYLTLLILLSVTTVHAAGETTKIFPFAYDQHDFPNGLRLVTIPTDTPNIVSVFIVMQTGSRNEVEPGKTGFAHLFEHMMFKGTKQYSAEKYQAMLKQAGAAQNAYTNDDSTVYHTTLAKPDLDLLLKMEADRFMHLEYNEAAIRTESLAVLGEYNKNSASPENKLFETLLETAFDTHTYKHPTMGFLKDVQDLPNQFEYSKQFFDRYYRPEYATIIIAGDIAPAAARDMVGRYFGEWKRGSFKPVIPAEPVQTGPRKASVKWPSPTLPYLLIAYKAPAYSDSEKDSAALDLIASLAFAENSELYQRLVVKEQKVDQIGGSYSNHVDPNLFTAFARVKKESDVEAVREAILSTMNGLKDTLVPAARLDAVKKNLRYSFALRLDDPERVAGTAARYVAMKRTPETMNRRFQLYSEITPEDIRAAARKYFVESGQTIVTLSSGDAK
jgi:zinc protease